MITPELEARSRGISIIGSAMIRPFFVSLCIYSLCGMAWAVTKYVDGGCNNNGDGTAIDCAASAGGPGPYNRMENAVLASGDTINVRGIHITHGSNHQAGTFDGRYFGDEFGLNTDCSASACVIQAYNWTANGTGEEVYLDGSRPSSSGWTQCVDCGGAGDCPNAGPAPCNDIWRTTDNGTAPAGFQSGSANRVLGAQKDAGDPTYRVQAITDLTNAHAGYNAKRCSSDSWRPCNVASDCVSGDTCNAGVSTEVDSYSDGSVGTTLYVRWGSAATPNSNKSYVMYSNAGTGINFLDTGSKAQGITIRGLTFRFHRRAGIYISSHHATDGNLTIQDCEVFFEMDLSGNGSDYGLTNYNTSKVVFKDSEVAYTGSEGVHGQAACGESACTTCRATDFDISNVWIHNTGDTSVLGPGTRGTPSGMIIGDSGSGVLCGDYTGSVFEKLLIQDTFATNSSGRGFIMENHMDNAVFRDSIVKDTNAESLKLDANTVSMDNNEIYNNIFINAQGGGSGWSVRVFAASGKSANNNKIYNNTIVNTPGGGISSDCIGTCTGNIFRNNLLYRNGNTTMVNWAPTDAGTLFENNLAFSTHSTAVVIWKGTSYTCAQVDADGPGVGNVCSDPSFVNAGSNDFHILTGSPAKDAGTATGMPTGRTTDITNTLADDHGLPDYNDADGIQGGTWDIGADEFVAAAGGTRPGAVIISRYRLGQRHLACP